MVANDGDETDQNKLFLSTVSFAFEAKSHKK